MNQHVALSSVALRVKLDVISGTVMVAGKRIYVSPQQFRLMKCLKDAHPEPVDTMSLYQLVWLNRPSESPRPENIVRVTACYLRRALRRAGCPVMIKGRKGVGYWLEAN